MSPAVSRVPEAPPPPQPLDLHAVYAAHAQYVWMTLQRLGVHRSDLEDLCQEVFVVVHRRLASYDPNARMSAWLFGICLRVVAAYRRRAFRRHEQPTDFDQNPPGASTAADPERAALDRHRRAQLVAVLDKMDLERRAVFVMFEIDGLGCAEIAELIGVPVGTVYSRLHAARKEFEKLAARVRAREGNT
jgi:RNA polymerase sigma-70 factor (ECF subfamily)